MNQESNRLNAEQVLARICAHGLMPAVGVYTADAAVAVARAMLAGGLDVMEITFRKPGAEQSIAAIRAAVPEMLVGAGTLLSVEQIEIALKAGAQFGVTPGFNPSVVRAAIERCLPFFPGVSSPGELEQALALGVRAVKVFPAEQLGGVAYMKALSGPYLHTGLKLIPMGGVSAENLPGYLALSMVGAAGGSWMVAEKAIAAKDWSAITELTKDAVKRATGAKAALNKTD
jgi:2-dehydro-3-deoxyphosphogluconate aldolase/(4S)-4-hydroxy-2-oxoglutarate aldolase